MAFFDKEELADCIRHNLVLLDDSGIAARIIPKPRRRPPAEGLPLELVRKCKKGVETEEEAEQPASLRDLFGIDKPCTSSSVPDPPALSLQHRIRTRLLAKLAEMEESGGTKGAIRAVQCAGQRPTADQCQIRFVPKDPTQAGPSKIADYTSLTTKLLADTQLVDDDISYAEFAKFEAMSASTNSMRFTIVFPFANCAISVHIVHTASIADLIGLACHIYTRQHREPPCEPPSNYDLFLAEEDTLEYDTELPPQDRHRRVADCGFPALAMVARKHIARRPSQFSQIQVKIFLTDGRCYAMELESLDVSLKKVFKYGMERKEADDQQAHEGNQNWNYFRDPGFVLEPLDQPGRVLDLSGSVCSSGTTDFVLLRKNSSRGENLLFGEVLSAGRAALSTMAHSKSMGDFTSVEQSKSADGGQLITGSMTMAEIGDWNKRQTRFTLLHPQLSCDSSGTLSRASGVQLAKLLQQQDGEQHLGGNILEEYDVNRIHRFQPKTPSKLVVRERWLELVPDHQQLQQQQEHRRKTSASVATVPPKKLGKIKRIPWELVAAVEVPPHSEQRPNARRTVRIIWLQCFSSSLNDNLVTELPEESSAYEGCSWKLLLIEAAGHEAWSIGVRLSELLDLRPSPVHLLYQHSAGATLKPLVAAEKAFGSAKKGSVSPKDANKLMSNPPITEKHTARKKLSLMFSRKRQKNE